MIVDEYFEWMVDLVCGKRYAKSISFRKLLAKLHSTEFIYLIPNDENRAKDGEYLRYRFVMDHDCEDQLEYLDEEPCSVLEMMLALAIRMEENIMDDPSVGDRTGQWFWGMIVNLGLGSMSDNRYDPRYVDNALTAFLNRDYEPDGKGGLFTVTARDDLREVEIWYQMNWYLDQIT
jgi:hypothetical protein